MKLQTSIPPRRDGTVKLAGLNGKEYEFAADAHGDLVCEVDDPDTVKHVLQVQGDYFGPADDESMQAAEALLASDLDDGSDAGDDGDADLEESNPNALPLEANTPPVTAPGKGKKAKG